MKTTFLTFGASSLIVVSASAALVLNAGFEANGVSNGNPNNWTVSVIGSTNGYGANNISDGFNGSYVYDDGDKSVLGNRKMYLNVISPPDTTTREFTATASVFEDDGTTEQLIAEGDNWELTVALGNRLGGGDSNYRDSSSVDLIVGYLATDGDISSFTAINSTSHDQATINAIGNNHFADFSGGSTVGAGHAAIGKELAIQIYAYGPSGGNGSTTRLQTAVDYVRVANVPEPSTTALLGLGGLALMLRRRH